MEETQRSSNKSNMEGWVSRVNCSEGGDKECYPQPMEAGVVIEELHLFWWEGSQHFLDGKELVNLTLSREQRLPVTQLS